MDGFVGLKRIEANSKFIVDGESSVFKKLVPEEEHCFHQLRNDSLQRFVPNFKGRVAKNDKQYLELENLLNGFQNPNIMDIKMGVRSVLEEEYSLESERTKHRSDKFKLIQNCNPEYFTEDEIKIKAITKLRFLEWLDEMSCTSSLGFRIESMRLKDGSVECLRLLKNETQAKDAINRFVGSQQFISGEYLNQLIQIEKCLSESQFFKDHSLIRTSLLFIHDSCKVRIAMIDFEKTRPVPQNIRVTHTKPWKRGSHEDGYLIGITNLIRIFSSLTNCNV